MRCSGYVYSPLWASCSDGLPWLLVIVVDWCDSLMDEWKYYGKKKGLADYLHDVGGSRPSTSSSTSRKRSGNWEMVQHPRSRTTPSWRRSLFPENVWVRLFLQYNTALPSSASVKRVFSYGSDILRAKRTSLAAQNFEALVFMKGSMKMLKKAHEVEYEEKERDEDEV